MSETPPANRLCGSEASDGQRCNHRLTRWFDGIGWRCRHHVPEGFTPFKKVRNDGIPSTPDPNGAPGEPALAPLEPCPVRRLRSLRDAEKMMDWAATAVANGLMSDARGKAIAMLCREWRNAHGDRVLKKEQDKLRRDMKNMKHKAAHPDEDEEES